MNVIIQKKPAFMVAGINFNDIESSSCPKVWDELYSKCTHEKLSEIGNGQNYGMCHDIENSKKINYMACYNVEDVKAAEDMGLEIIRIPEAEYAIVDLQGRIPDCIHWNCNHSWNFPFVCLYLQTYGNLLLKEI